MANGRTPNPTTTLPSLPSDTLRYVLKSSGGYRTSRALFTHYTKRWLVLKDSYGKCR